MAPIRVKALADHSLISPMVVAFTSGSENATGGTYGVQNGLVISTPSNGRPPTAALALRLYDDQLLENGE